MLNLFLKSIIFDNILYVRCNLIYLNDFTFICMMSQFSLHKLHLLKKMDLFRLFLFMIKNVHLCYCKNR